MHDPVTGQPVIEPDLARTIGERVGAIMAERGIGAIAPALIVQPRARRALAALMRQRAPGCVVLSIAELPPTQPIEVVAVIGEEAPRPPQLPAPGHGGMTPAFFRSPAPCSISAETSVHETRSPKLCRHACLW
jgi:flagellar biosynthesis protein FlhA